MRPWLLIPLLVLLLVTPAGAAAKKALFDNYHAETAGNADWEIDTHQPVPSPAQSGIGPNTPGTFWVGAISSWGVDLVKRGYTVATNTTALTYGSGSNPYDLSNYDVLIVDEPNTLFSSAEATAILNFVHDGGGLVAISDHSGSDRNNDGYDSPMIWNALDPTHLLGAHFGVSADANNNITQTSTNVNALASDSLTRGPVGNVTGFAFHNGTTLTLYPSANPSVRGEVWMSGLSQTSTTGLMAASSVYGSGRVFLTCDSSPADDGSATSGNSSIYDGWGEAGATDSTLFLNATLWATRRTTTADVTAPVVSVSAPDGGETWKAGSTHAVSWTASDAVGVSSVDLAYSTDGGASFPNAIATGIVNSGSWSWTVPNTPSGTARVRVLARDAAGNVGRDSSAAVFTIDRWTITASAGPGGSVTPGGAVPVVEGASQGFSIRPDPGSHVLGLTVDGGAVTPDTSYTFSDVTAGHTLAATFSADQYPLTVSTVGGGTVTKVPDQASYAYGTIVELDPVPAAGWAFAGWSGDTSGSGDPVSLAVNGSRAVTATFVDVAAPVVTLSAPVGGEAWGQGTPREIRWTASDNAGVDSVDVDYSLSGPGGPWQAVAHGVANTGTYAWTVPGVASDSARVRVTAWDAAHNAGQAASDSSFRIVDPTAGVWGSGPAVLALARPQPNPSRGGTLLRFSLPAAGHARLEVVDVSGRRLGSSEGEYAAGAQSWRWDGRNPDGGELGAGLYFVRLATAWGTRTERLVRLR